MKLTGLLLSAFLLMSLSIFAQEGSISGKIVDDLTNEPIPFANIVIQGTTDGASADLDGNFKLEGLEPGVYNLEVSSIGYEAKVLFEVRASAARPTILEVRMAENQIVTEDVVITADVFEKRLESPLSLRSVGANEIEKFPGANRDISRVILSFPGVTTTVSFRNDLIIRGGNPNENRFFLDGIEVPNINHFATQGASGGSNGLINVDFIRNVDFFSGAFPANRGNALSSVFDFSFKDGRKDKFSSRFTLGATEAGISLEGPLNKKKTGSFIASYRRSYQQLLFKAFGLPFLPTFNDLQFKLKQSLKNGDDITIIGLGAIDDFNLNLGANETDEQLYLLNQLPYIDQLSYTIGAKYRHFGEKGYLTLVLSRSQVANEYEKFAGNQNDDPNALLFRLSSDEIENKLRAEYTTRVGGFKINYGGNYELTQYNNRTSNNIPTGDTIIPVDYSSDFLMNKYGAFAQASKAFVGERLSLSLGLRLDGADFNSETSNPFRQISPRFSASYQFTPALSVNFNTGRYAQLPAFTTLGFADNNNVLVNRRNGLGYIYSNHFVLGTSYTLKSNTQFSVEGFWKMYDNYPFLLNDSISAANVGGFFGVFGDEPASSMGKGRTYGVELMAQQRYYRGWYGIISYTFFRSEFQDKNLRYVQSAWNVGHTINVTGGKELGKNWDIGFRFALAGGSPFTPFDVQRSSLREVWDLNGEGVFDYDRLNTERTRINQQLDIRVDKRWFFAKWNLNLYLDIRNIYAAKSNQQDYIDVQRDMTGSPIIDPTDNTRYLMRSIRNDEALVLPSIGIVVEL